MKEEWTTEEAWHYDDKWLLQELISACRKEPRGPDSFVVSDAKYFEGIMLGRLRGYKAPAEFSPGTRVRRTSSSVDYKSIGKDEVCTIKRVFLRDFGRHLRWAFEFEEKVGRFYDSWDFELVTESETAAKAFLRWAAR
jgi:hypothetical protein